MPQFLTFDSSEVCELVGIGPLLLNKFVERRTYGIQPSVRSGKGRGGRRLFSPDDVFGIAFVWWLFESGLRSGVIENILDQICKPAKGIASETGKRLVERKIQKARVRMEPRGLHSGSRKPNKPDLTPDLAVFLITTEDPRKMRLVMTELEIPIGLYYSVLLDKMKKGTGLPEGD